MVKRKKLNADTKRKIKSAQSASFISRTRAMRKLQLTLPQFRRLCVIKGIHPVEASSKGLARHRTYYHMMDVRFIGHDRLIDDIKNFNIHKKKMKRAVGRRDFDVLDKLKARTEKLKLDHVIRERYPTFMDALNDLEDPLCMIFICARMKNSKYLHMDITDACARTAKEFMTYIAKSRSLRKVFVTIKGIYYQAEIMGVMVNWLVPFEFALNYEDSIDIRLINNFIEFYLSLMKFVNYRLYTSLGYQYPPKDNNKKDYESELFVNLESLEKVDNVGSKTAVPASKKAHVQEVLQKAQKGANNTRMSESDKARIASLESKMVDITEDGEKQDEEKKDEEEEEAEGEGEVPTEIEAPEGADASADEDAVKLEVAKREKMLNLFSGLVFFLNREVPMYHVGFMIQAFGGTVSTDQGNIKQDNSKITHQIVDREVPAEQRVTSREYVQPQWVFDSINAGILLPVHEYASDVVLPPHLSPFEVAGEDDYVPIQRKHLDSLIARETKKWDGTDLEGGEGEVEGEEESDEEEEEEEEDEDTIEAQYEAELKAERGGTRASDVAKAKEAAAQAAREEKEAAKEEQRKLNKAAGLEYLNASKPAKPKKPTKEQLQKQEEIDRLRPVVGVNKNRRYQGILDAMARQEEKKNNLLNKRIAIEEKRRGVAKKKMEQEEQQQEQQEPQQQQHDDTNDKKTKKNKTQQQDEKQQDNSTNNKKTKQNKKQEEVTTTPTTNNNTNNNKNKSNNTNGTATKTPTPTKTTTKTKNDDKQVQNNSNKKRKTEVAATQPAKKVK